MYWHRIVLQPITHLHVHVCSSHVYLLSDNAFFKTSQGIVTTIYNRYTNNLLKWQHIGAICAV